MNFRNNFFQNNNVPGSQDPVAFNGPSGNFNPNMNNFNHPAPNNSMPPDFARSAAPTYPPRFNAPNQFPQSYGYEDQGQGQPSGGNVGYYTPYRRNRAQQYVRPSHSAPQQYDFNQGNQNHPAYQQPLNDQFEAPYYGNDQYNNVPAQQSQREQYNRISRPIADQRRKLAYSSNVGSYDEDTYNYDDYYDEPSVREEDSRSHKSRFFTKLAARRKRNDDLEEERNERPYSRKEDERRVKRKTKSRRDEYEEDDFDDFDDEEDEDYEEERRPSRSKKLKKRPKSRYEDEEDDFDDFDDEEDERSKKRGFFSGPVDFFKKKKRG